MPRSIPFDPGLALGGILHPDRVKALEALAEAQKPSEIANDRLQALIQQNYKIKMIFNQMVNQNVSETALGKLKENMKELREAMVKAAVDLGKKTVQTEFDVKMLKLRGGQTTISTSMESPVDYANSPVSRFPIAFDAIQFDVQYYRVETSADESTAELHNKSEVHARSISAGVSGFLGASASETMTSTVHKTSVEQSSIHKTEATIVLCAKCTHSKADIIEPLVINPSKAVTAWNYLFPKDKIKVDPESIFEAAFSTSSDSEEENEFQILSGCSKGSSFVGCVHILQTEDSYTSQEAESTASSFQQAIETSLILASFTGNMGTQNSASSTAASLLSTSRLENHVSLVCEGTIPNIVTDKVTTTVMDMKPNPEEIMGNLSAIANASADVVNKTEETFAQEGKVGTSFGRVNSDFYANAMSTATELQDQNNQVINTNSMLNCFTDFCNEVVSGEGGVPINFFLKRYTKADVAVEYMLKHYPNGAIGTKGLRGQLGMESN